MRVTKEDLMLLMRLDELYKPQRDARKFTYSKELAEVVSAGTFFDTYSLDSDERFYINEIATYFDHLGVFVVNGLVDKEVAVEWSGPSYSWKRIGPILIQSREIFGDDRLWVDFETIAT